MLPYHPQTPILLIVSDRVLWPAQTFDLLAAIRPECLYVYSCGLQAETVQRHISWPCSLRFKQESQTRRAARPLIAANRWFFQREEAGIVLNLASNWGCLPSVGFFGFCAELLEKYRTDERIGQISCGRILRSEPTDRQASYTFSHVPDISFYASWRRTWQDFDLRLRTFRAFKASKLLERLPAYREFAPYWSAASTGKDLPEAAQCEYVSSIDNRLCVVPVVPLLEHLSTGMDSVVHPLFMIEEPESALPEVEFKMQTPYKRLFEDAAGIDFLEECLDKTTRPSKIPKIIHHVCDYPNGIPENLLTLAATWKKHHPGWEQHFWDRQQMEEFVHTVCPDFEPYYRAFPHDVQRWDAVRYLILYHIGGMYVDLDYECFRSFDPVVNGRSCCIAVEPALNAKCYGLSQILSNALMAAAPGSRFMARIIDEMKSLDLDGMAHLETWKFVLETTGPLMLTRVYESAVRKKEITLLPAQLFMPLTPKEVRLAVSNKTTEFIRYKLNHAFALHYFLNSW